MKIAAGQAEAFCRSDQPKFHAILIYGPDEGRVRERGKQLALAVTKGDTDPFLSAELSNNSLDENPSALIDEALQLSLMGGRRVVRFDGATDKLVDTIKSLVLETLPLPAQVILLAGELSPRSKLRSLFEKQASLACVATYVDDTRSLGDTVRDWAREQQRQISREAETLLVESLGGDRALTRQELEKLSIYMASEPAERRIELADVQACLSGLTNLDQDAPLFAALAGDTNQALSQLNLALRQGRPAEALCAGFLFHLNRLSEGQSLVHSGLPPAEAVAKMRPPVFFQKKAPMTAQLQRLSNGPLLGRLYLMALALQKEVRLSKDQAPMHLERFLMQIGHLCRR